MMAYRGYDKRDRIKKLWVISLPDATPRIGRRVGPSASAMPRSKARGCRG